MGVHQRVQELTAESADELLEARELECVRRDRALFSGLSFALGCGDCAQVKGANGSGKTSLLRILCGLSAPAHGEVRWRGESLHGARGRALGGIGFLGHAHGVKDPLTPYENLEVARRLAASADGPSGDEALAQLGLEGLEDVPCRTLSAGQRRRVALARLVVARPRLWILDEPLTALDRDGVALLERLLREHLDTGGLAVLSTHQPLSVTGRHMTQINLGHG